MKRLVLCLFAVPALLFAQTRPADITVSKNTDPAAGIGMYKTIQEAVNAAKAGSIIEILDAEVYEEQVTIDGREESPWPSVTGGKNGITLRSKAGAGADKPTIRYRDITNTSPKNSTEAEKSGELAGSAGNFEACASVRVLYAKGVTIEGIAVDGVSAFAFGYPQVWGGGAMGFSPLVHGNAAISLVVSGNVTIRDCDIKNAYFGMYVKDRNTGGVFGNPNPADGDATIPLSGFGKSGNHLIEYSRIHDNSVGVFFESAWDLGSTVRYNLIYNNTQKASVASLPEADNINAGALMFKDNYLTPVAIYNNTLYNNTGNLLGNWQVGGQHLVFNNIFSRPSSSRNPGNDHMSLDGKFPFRMNNCVFSADATSANGGIRVQTQSNFDCDNPMAPGGKLIVDVQLSNQFQEAQRTSVSLNSCSTISPGPVNQQMVLPGAIIPGVRSYPATTFPAGANIRWLQTEGGRVGSLRDTLTLDTLFQSLTADDPDFLAPKWDHPQVIEFIKNQGWELSGVRNSDGQIADLGAIPSSGTRRPTVARIAPTNVVTLNTAGTTANVSFSLNVDGGALLNPKIKMLRWIAPIPPNCQDGTAVQIAAGCNGNDWPGNLVPVPGNSIRNIADAEGTPVTVGNNANVSLPTGATGALPRYGFYEIVVDGTDASGNPVTSDIGFLPYRPLSYFLDLEFFPAEGEIAEDTPPLTSVVAGDSVRLRVTPRGAAAAFTGTLKEVSYSSLSGGAASMFMVSDGEPEPLISDSGLSGATLYSVYFTRAGDETVLASGYSQSGGNNLVFVGSASVRVLPSEPAQIAMLSPIPRRAIPAGVPPPAINPASSYPVRVEVRDRFGNAVNAVVPVTAASSDTLVGRVSPATATTDPKTGIAAFTARVTGGSDGEIFDITATLILAGTTDIGRLQINSAAPIAVKANERAVPAGAAGGQVSIVPIRGGGDGDSRGWKVLVKNNPFRSGTGNSVGIEITPNATSSVKAKAAITIFDRDGNTILKKSVGGDDGNIIKYEWSGVDKKGRSVGTGVYLIKAVCVNKKDKATITRSVGVIRR